MRLGSVPSVIYLGFYVILVFIFSGIYFVLPGRSFYHSTSQYEYNELDADAGKILSSLVVGIRNNLSQFYETDRPTIRGWVLDTRFLEASSLSVKEFPEEFGFELTAPIWIQSKSGRIQTHLQQKVTVPLQSYIATDGVVYFYLQPDKSVPSPIEGIPPVPNLQELLPYGRKIDSFRAPGVEMSTDLYRRIIGFGEGFRGFPTAVEGQYWRVLYFSAGLATASALGDIVPLTTTARFFVTFQALLSLVTIGLFLNALANDIAGTKQSDCGARRTGSI